MKSFVSYGLALVVAAFSICLAGCGPRSIDGVALPKNYGVYAVDDGKMIPLGEKMPDLELSPTVKFLIFDKLVTTGLARVPLYNIPITMDELPSSSQYQMPGFSEFAARLEEHWNMPPSNASRMQIQETPLEGKPEMLVVSSSTPLRSGCYQFGSVRFWVNRKGFVGSLKENAQASLKNREWIRSVCLALTIRKLDASDESSTSVIADAHNGLMQDANVALQDFRWDDAAKAASLSLRVVAGSPEATQFLKNLPIKKATHERDQALKKAMGEGREALKNRSWDAAIEACRKVLELKPGDTEALQSLKQAEFGKHDDVARINFEHKQWNPSIDAIRHVLTLKNDSADHWRMWEEAHYNLYYGAAEEAFRRGDLDNALEQVGHARALRPSGTSVALESKIKEALTSQPAYYGKYFKSIQSTDYLPGSVDKIQLMKTRPVVLVHSSNEVVWWNLQENTLTRVCDGDGFLLSRDETKILFYGPTQKVLDVNTGATLWAASRAYITVDGFLPDSKGIYGRTAYGQALIADYTTPSKVEIRGENQLPAGSILVTENNRRITGLLASPDGKYLAAHNDDFIYIWESARRTLVKTLPISYFRSMAFSNDGKKFFFSDPDRKTTIFLVDEDWRVKAKLPFSGPILGISPDNTKIAFNDRGFLSSSVQIWDVTKYSQQATIKGGGQIILRPDWSTLSFSYRDGVLVFDPNTGRELGKILVSLSSSAYDLSDTAMAVQASSDRGGVLCYYGRRLPSDDHLKQAVARVCEKAQMNEYVQGALVDVYYDGDKIVARALAGKQPPECKFDAIREVRCVGAEFTVHEKSGVRPMLDGEIVDRIASESDPDFKTFGYAVIISHPSVGARPTLYSLVSQLTEKPTVEVGEQVVGGKTVLGYVDGQAKEVFKTPHLEIRRFKERSYNNQRGRTLNLQGMAEKECLELLGQWLDLKSTLL